MAKTDSDERTVLIIARNRITNDGRVLKEARSLTAAGYRVTILGIVESPEDKLSEEISGATVMRVQTAIRSQSKASRGQLPSSSAKAAAVYRGWLGDLRHWIGRMRENRIYFRTARSLNPGIVISCDLLTLPAGYLFKKRCGSKLVYDSHELFLEQTGSRTHVYRVLYGVTERILIRKADAVVTVNDMIAAELGKRYRIPVPTVVMNGPEHIAHDSLPAHSPLRAFYQGVYIPGRGLEELIDVMADADEHVSLTLQGFGPLEQALRLRTAELGLENCVHFIDPCPPDRTVEAARHFDIGLVLYRPVSLNNYYASPNKLFDYMAAGLAVVGSRMPFIEQVVTNAGCGHLFDPEHVRDAVQLLQEMALDPTAVSEMKRRSLAAAREYSWSGQADKLLSAIDAVEDA